MSRAERGANTMNAAGTYVPPLFVFPRKRMVASLMNGAPAAQLLESINGDRAT